MNAKKSATPVVDVQETRTSQPGRNEPCHCGSGKKYKKCHLNEDDIEERKLRLEKAAQTVASAPEILENAKPKHSKTTKNKSNPMSRGKKGSGKTTFQRKTGGG